MSEKHGPPKVWQRIGDGRVICDGAFVRCPNCSEVARIDEDQYCGRVSMVCPNGSCDYHETHDLRGLYKR